jgi:carbon monoxide dehydrogenase subunit G
VDPWLPRAAESHSAKGSEGTTAYMEMTGEYRIAAPREKVWAALNDPEILKASIPGCQELEKRSDTEMSAKVVSKIGPVKATFLGEVTLSNINPPSSYTISGEGKGGVAGFAKGGADVVLAEDGPGTILRYTAKAQVGGKLAQLGARLIDATARQMAEQFFSAFAERVGGGAPVPAAAAVMGDSVPVPGAAPVTATAPVEETLVQRAEHVVEDAAHDVSVVAHEAEEKVEEAAVREWLGGPQMWGLLALAAVIIAIAIFYM